MQELEQSLQKSIGEMNLLSIPLYKIIEAAILAIICAVVIKVITVIVKKVLARSKSDSAIQGFIRSGLKFVLWLVALIIIASTLGLNTASLVAVLSVVGLALSLAVQGLVGNIFSGFTLVGAKPFVPGDYVEVDSYQGHVREIGFFYTKIVTLDNRLVYFPNSTVAKSDIVNFTAMKIRRVDVYVGVSYDEDPDEVIAALVDTMRSLEQALEEPVPKAGLESYDDSSIQYVARVWANSEDYWPVYYELRRRIWKTFKERNLEISYPHMNVHMSDNK